MQEPIDETEQEDNGLSITRFALYAAVALVVIIVLPFLIGVGLAVFTDPQPTAMRIDLIRDVIILILSIEGILIILALVAAVLQIVRLVALLRNESKPILQDTKETTQIVKGTAGFVSKNVLQPIIEFSSFLAALAAFIREIAGIRRAIRPTKATRDSNDEQ